MKALVITLALASISPALADFKWGERFEHAGHAEKMRAKGKGSPDCASCHPLDARDFSPIAPGRLDHKPCVDCHSGAEFMRGPRCLTCHSNIRAFKPGKPWFPPYRSPGEFHVQLSHKKHVAMLQGDTCGGCHAKQEGRAERNRGHMACASCHAGSAQPDMNQCEGCHRLGPAPARVSSASQPSPYRTSARFDHVTHARAAAQERTRVTCVSCHQGLSGQETPGRPTMQMCEGCHDGRAAFDARGTRCGKCHAGTPPPPLPPPPRGFLHVAHRGQLDVDQCAQCHAGGAGASAEWRAVAPGRNAHHPCQDSCHAGEFRMRKPSICLACHEHNEPFAPNPLRPPVRGQSEYRLSALPHPPHVSAGVACESCHAREAGVSAAGPSGHALCGKCHTDGHKLPLALCRACHVSVASSGGAALRPRGEWTVRARFKHDAAHRGPGCAGCHRAADTTDVVTPKMKQCADGCHDGKRAFKATGHGCARCHGGKT